LINVCFINFFYNCRSTTENSEIRNHAVDILISLTMDMRTESFHKLASITLNSLIGEPESEARQIREHLFVLNGTYNLIVDYTSNSEDTIK
jgi:hypothetical protein